MNLLQDTGVPLLEMRNISKSFGESQVLSGVSIRLAKGEVHCLVGENGAGKSTLMKILAGLYRADSGEIYVEGRSVAIRSPLDGLHQGVGVVYQELELVPDLTVAENIGLGREPKRAWSLVDWNQLRSLAKQSLQLVGLTIDPNTLVRSLTVAERQLLAIAKTLSFDPAILVFDEPSAVLGGRDLLRLHELVQSLGQRGCGIIYISHRLEEVFEIGSTVTVLRDGRVVGTMPVSDATPKGLVQLMVGREMSRLFPPRKESTSPVERLTVRDLSGRVIKNVSYSLHIGEILGCAGLVGSGLDELARLVGGVESVKHGTITVDGVTMRKWNPREAIRAGVGLVPEDRKTEGLVLNQSIFDNMSYAAIALKNQRGGLVNRRELDRLTSRFKDVLNIKAGALTGSVENLSGGNQQKVVLAKVLAIEPKVLILDEPTRGVDVATKLEIYQIIVDLAASGAAILLISSELAELTALSHRILVFSEGRMTAELHPPYVDTEILTKALPTAVSAGGR